MGACPVPRNRRLTGGLKDWFNPETAMAIPYRPLGLITEVIEHLGLEVTYAYEDLVFISSNAFLLRMGSNGEQVDLCFHQDVDPASRGPVRDRLVEEAAARGLTVVHRGTYTMQQQPDEQVEIHFSDPGDATP